MTTIDTDIIRAALEAVYPAPKEEYEHTFYCQEVQKSLIGLTKTYKSLFLEGVNEIEAGGLLSAAFILRKEERTTREVNVPLLRKNLPDLFQEIVHISTGNAAKLLSNRFIYAEVKKLIGGRITHYDEVNLDDLEARLPEPEFSEYVKITLAAKGYTVYEVN